VIVDVTRIRALAWLHVRHSMAVLIIYNVPSQQKHLSLVKAPLP
jgi:hypothetical protein